MVQPEFIVRQLDEDKRWAEKHKCGMWIRIQCFLNRLDLNLGFAYKILRHFFL